MRINLVLCLISWELNYRYDYHIEDGTNAGLILGLRPANERRRYFVTTSLIGCAQAYNQPWNGHHFANNIFKCISLNKNVRILVQILLIFIPKDPTYNKSSVQVMALCHIGDEPLPEPKIT